MHWNDIFLKNKEWKVFALCSVLTVKLAAACKRMKHLLRYLTMILKFPVTHPAFYWGRYSHWTRSPTVQSEAPFEGYGECKAQRSLLFGVFCFFRGFRGVSLGCCGLLLELLSRKELTWLCCSTFSVCLTASVGIFLFFFFSSPLVVVHMVLRSMPQCFWLSPLSLDQGFPTFLWPCTLQQFERWACTPKISYDKNAEQNFPEVLM